MYRSAGQQYWYVPMLDRLLLLLLLLEVLMLVFFNYFWCVMKSMFFLNDAMQCETGPLHMRPEGRFSVVQDLYGCVRRD